MDWGDAEDFVRFGAVGGQHIDDCDYYILLCPQNVVGNTIMTGLLDMVRLPGRSAPVGTVFGTSCVRHHIARSSEEYHRVRRAVSNCYFELVLLIIY